MDLRNIYASDIKSRALDIEEEESLDEAEERNNFLFEWESATMKNHCSRLFVLVGSAASDVCKTCALNKMKVVGAIVEESKPKNKVNVYSFDVKDSITYVICTVQVAYENVFSWTNTVISNLCNNLSVVTVLHLDSIGNYIGQYEEMSETFVRVLHTSNHSAKLKFKQLEQPSMVQGLPALLLFQAEITGMQCAVCVVYSRDTNPYFFILDTLKRLGWEDIIEKADEEKVHKMKVVEIQNSGHLYT